MNVPNGFCIGTISFAVIVCLAIFLTMIRMAVKSRQPNSVKLIEFVGEGQQWHVTETGKDAKAYDARANSARMRRAQADARKPQNDLEWL